AFAGVTADGVRPAALPPARPPLAVVALLTTRAGKPLAWNVLRCHARAPVAIFFDADVSFAPDAFRLLLAALAEAPGAALASGKTTCAPRPRAFERIMAAPYGVDFPNLSAQLYAARLDTLPAAIRLPAYLGMRSLAHVVAWWRYRRGATAGIWRQAATTKRWDPA